MGKNLLAVLIGLVIAFVVDGLFTTLVVGGVGAESTEDGNFGNLLAENTNAALLLVAGWALAALLGAFASRLVLDKYTPNGIPLIASVGVIIGILAIGIPNNYPIWVIAAGAAVAIPAGLIGNNISKKMKK